MNKLKVQLFKSMGNKKIHKHKNELKEKLNELIETTYKNKKSNHK